jgi:hypothetical protein
VGQESSPQSEIAGAADLGFVSEAGASCNGWDQEDAITFLERARLAAEEADVFFVEIDVQKLANLSAFVTDVAGQGGELASEGVQRFGNGRGATVDTGRAVGEAAESGGNFNGHWHLFFGSLLSK